MGCTVRFVSSNVLRVERNFLGEEPEIIHADVRGNLGFVKVQDRW